MHDKSAPQSFRVLARELAQHLTQEEIQQVAGGLSKPDCRLVGGISKIQGHGVDKDVRLECVYP